MHFLSTIKLLAFQKWLSAVLLSSFLISCFHAILQIHAIIIFLAVVAIHGVVSVGGYIFLNRQFSNEDDSIRYFNQEFNSLLPSIIFCLALVIKIVKPNLPIFSEQAIIGHLYFPWLSEMTKVQSLDYIILIIIGLGWLATAIIKLIYWLRRTQKYIELEKKQHFLFGLALIFIIWTQGWAAAIYPPTGDDVHYLLMTTSIASDGDVDLKNNFQNKSWQLFYPSDKLDYHGIPDQEGHWYSRHMPALSLMLTPGYLMLKRYGAVLLNLVMVALACLMMLKIALKLFNRKLNQLLPFFLALIAAPLSLYGYLVYPVVIGSWLSLVAFYAYLELPKKKAVFLLGLIIGALPWFHQGLAAMALVFLSFGIISVMNSKSIKLLLLFAIGGCLTGVPFLGVFINDHIITLSEGVYRFAFKWDFILAAFLGLWVDRYYGIIVYAPIYIAAWSGLILGIQKKNKPLWLILVLVIVNIIMSLLFVDWNGFSGACPRFLASFSFSNVSSDISFIKNFLLNLFYSLISLDRLLEK